MNVKISIIIPIHNTPLEVLKDSLQSILNQSLHSYEVICVDDGSKEYVYQEIETLTKEYLNLKIIRLEKAVGAAEARNKGLEIANGKYVICLDSDDVFDEKLLEKSYETAVGNDSDLTLIGYEKFNNGSFESIKIENYDLVYDELYLCRLPLSPWTKLVKREFLERENIYFQSLSSCNDVYYSVMALLKAKKISVVKSSLIKYRTGELNQISSHRDPINFYKAIDKILKDLVGTEYSLQTYQTMIYALLLEGMFQEISMSNNEEKNKELYLLCQAFFEDNDIVFHDLEYEARRKELKYKNYETFWFKNIRNYKGQLEKEAKSLIEKLSSKNIVLWGMGKRGKAFMDWAERIEQVKIVAICDGKNDKCNEEINNIQIINTNDIDKFDNIMIVASNTRIYEYVITDLFYDSKKVLNLELYCPI